MKDAPSNVTLEELLELARRHQRDWEPLQAQARLEGPVALADDADADDDGDDVDADDDDDAGDKGKKKSSKSTSSPGGSDADDADDSGDGDDDDDDAEPKVPDGKVLVDQKEFNRLKRTVSEADKARKKDERKKAQEEGRYNDIIADTERERDEALAGKEEAENELEEFKQRIAISGVARRLGYHDPEMAFDLLPEDDRTDDEQSVEVALKALGKKKPFLVDKGKRSGAPIDGDGKKETTPEQGLRGAIKDVLVSRRTEG